MSDRQHARRRKAFLGGLEAEWLAAVYLRLKGYRIVQSRFLGGGGEIDLIAWKGSALVFVEVKSRPNLDQAAEAVTREKLRRIARAARVYLGRLPRLPETIRCDAVLMAPGRLPRHIRAVAELPLD